MPALSRTLACLSACLALASLVPARNDAQQAAPAGSPQIQRSHAPHGLPATTPEAGPEQRHKPWKGPRASEGKPWKKHGGAHHKPWKKGARPHPKPWKRHGAPQPKPWKHQGRHESGQQPQPQHQPDERERRSV